MTIRVPDFSLPPMRGARPVEMDTTPVACLGEELDEIWWRGRQWAVTSFGVECLDGTYAFEAKRLAEGCSKGDSPQASWIVHMAEKSWVDLDDFATAWLVALSLHGVHVASETVRRVIAEQPLYPREEAEPGRISRFMLTLRKLSGKSPTSRQQDFGPLAIFDCTEASERARARRYARPANTCPAGE